jgi:hypothetical protein
MAISKGFRLVSSLQHRNGDVVSAARHDTPQ